MLLTVRHGCSGCGASSASTATTGMHNAHCTKGNQQTRPSQNNSTLSHIREGNKRKKLYFSGLCPIMDLKNESFGNRCIQFWLNVFIFCGTLHPRELVSTIGMHVAHPTFLAKAAAKKCILKSPSFCGSSTRAPRTG